MKVPVTVNRLVDGHVGLDLECLDRVCLNGYVPSLQVSGQVVNFVTHHMAHLMLITELWPLRIDSEGP